jgi:hypothetical protein
MTRPRITSEPLATTDSITSQAQSMDSDYLDAVV